jgi:nicotinamide-nucleotide amidase
LQLKVTATNKNEAQRLLQEGEEKIRQIFGEAIWGIDDETLETVIGRLMMERKITLAVMEDYTGGLLTSTIAAVPGSRSFFNGGIIAQTEKAKSAFGVSEDLISNSVTTSGEIAMAMAEAARRYLGANIGIGVSGSGPADNPAVKIAIVNGKYRQTIARPRGKERVVTTILFQLRKLLLEKQE